MAERPTVHACAVLVGARALLIRGPAGSGKSLLTLKLIAAAQSGLLSFARLVGDDRIRLEPCHGRLLVRAPDTLAGLIEVRGLGIRQLPHEPVAVVGGVVDLAAADAQRLPEQAEIEVEGIKVSQLKIAENHDPYPSVLAWLTSRSADEALVAEK
jgi:serine kinase of HPr protein (carbohydrate metabolism regulator)